MGSNANIISSQRKASSLLIIVHSWMSKDLIIITQLCGVFFSIFANLTHIASVLFYMTYPNFTHQIPKLFRFIGIHLSSAN